MKTIHKYALPISDIVYVDMPIGARIIKIDCDLEGKASIWAEVDTIAMMHCVRFLIRGTGHPFTGEENEHLATFKHGYYIWHVYSSITEG